MQNQFYDNKPDPLEKKVRFGCGFLFGLVLGFYEIVRVFLYGSAGKVVIAVVIVALVCGLLALKYGDRFWHTVLSRMRWWM